MPADSRPVLLDLGPVQQLRAGRLPRRLVQLLLGLVLFGSSLALVVRAGLGTAPWDVLHVAVAARTPFSFGTALVGVSVLVLLAWVPLRQRPGVGTVGNALLVGVFADLTLSLLGPLEHPLVRVVALLAGVALNGVATAVYLGAQLGPGPRDGLMTGLARLTGRSVRLVRTVLEVTVVVVGFALGGSLGVGTVLYALAIGPVTQAVLPYVTVRLDVPGPGTDAGTGAGSGGPG